MARHRSSPYRPGLIGAVVAALVLACSSVESPTPLITASPGQPSPTPVIIAGIDMIKASDERDLAQMSDVILIGRAVAEPRPKEIGDDVLVDYFVEVRVEQVLKGGGVSDVVPIQWLGVSPEIDNFIADADLEPLDRLIDRGTSYLLFLFRADLPETYNIVGHLNGLYPITSDGLVQTREGGFEAFDGQATEGLGGYLAELAD